MFLVNKIGGEKILAHFFQGGLGDLVPRKGAKFRLLILKI